MLRSPACLRWIFALALGVIGPALARAQAAAPDNPAPTPEVAALRALPAPLVSNSGMLAVSCKSAERAAYRWPVLKFAETTQKNLSEFFLPLGTADSPLSISIGTETNALSTVGKDLFRLSDGSFSQLVIRVPNPDTVDLEILRCAIAEALLRERARAGGPSYAALTWPAWFIRGVVDASKGNVFLAEAYETLHAALEAGTLPTPEALLAAGTPPPDPAIGAYFARWMVESRRATPAKTGLSTSPAERTRAMDEAKRRTEAALVALLTTPFTAEALLPPEAATAWPAWIRSQEDRVLLPGTLTLSQFERWQRGLAFPEEPAAAKTLYASLVRSCIGKPAIFTDLVELYLRVCSASTAGDQAAARRAWTEAEEARKLLHTHLQREKVLLQDPKPLLPGAARTP